MKQNRVAVTALTAIFTLAACAENPVSPASDARAPVASAFTRGVARAYSFRTVDVDVPGATQTVLSGINADGVIVGWYFGGTGCSAPCLVRGLIYNAGTFTTVVYHDAEGRAAVVTQLRGISPSGEIVGSFRMAEDPPATGAHGFIYTTTGEFIRVDYAPHINTIAQRILPDGTILGCLHDGDMGASMHGIVVGKKGSSALDMGMTMNNGGTPSGNKITGFFTDATGKVRAYVVEGDEFTPFDAPHSFSTQAWDMSPSGTIVGLFQDEAGTHPTHGFVLEHGQFTRADQFSTIDYPGSTYTDVFGINPAGDIVGKYRAPGSNAFHGYVATRRPD